MDERGSLNKIIFKETLQNDSKMHPVVEVIATTNLHKGTLRGLHFESLESNSYKMVSCIRGVVEHFFVDVRLSRKSFLEHETIRTSADDQMVFKIPPGIAYGYQTLQKDSIILYGITTAFNPNTYLGLNFFDPMININLSIKKYVISEKDKNLPFASELK